MSLSFCTFLCGLEWKTTWVGVSWSGKRWVDGCVSCLTLPNELSLLVPPVLTSALQMGVSDEGLRALASAGCGEKLTALHFACE